MGALALFLVIAGGTAYAANTVGSSDVINESLLSQDIKNGEVKTAELANNAVRTGNIAYGQVTKADLAVPEPWHAVGPGSTTEDLCSNPANTAVFCSDDYFGSLIPWNNFFGGHASAAFYKDQLGIVRLKGLVSNLASETTEGDPQVSPIFRLPAGYRPSSQRVFASIGRREFQEVTQARVDVKADGLVLLEIDCNFDDTCSAGGGYVTLDGISFRPDE